MSHVATSANLLLATLPTDASARLLPHLERVELHRRVLLVGSDQPIGHMWFPVSGVASQIAVSPDGDRVECGLFGRDGLAGQALLLGVDQSPHETFMQVNGVGYRIGADDLRAAWADVPAIREHLLRFVQVSAVQMAHTALANAVHSLPERLARWLLMCHDRAEGDSIELTHEFMALMLAVRRAGVTTALHVLEGRRLIRSTRGVVTVRDRAGLQDFAADSYGVPEAEYARLIAPLSKGGTRRPG